MNKTNIGYCTHTWNATHGCSPVSDGCRSCWAEAMAKRLAAMGAPHYDPTDPFKVVCMPEKLDEPIRKTKPSVIAVSFMGDAFHEDVPDEFLAEMFAIMAIAPQHRFIVLTKRAKRMYEFTSKIAAGDAGLGNALRRTGEDRLATRMLLASALGVQPGGVKADFVTPPLGPIPNIMGMVTVENQEAADERIPWLLKSPFAMKGLSLEPLLGPVDFRKVPGFNRTALDIRNDRWWMISGCESGPHARPMNPDWARLIRDLCQIAGVPFYLKQMMVDGKLSHSPELDGRERKEIPEGMKV